MTPAQHKRALAIRGLIEQGWNPPTPRGTVAARMLDDIFSIGSYGETLALAPRESEFLRLLADGYTKEQAGVEMGLATETVKDYSKRLLRKLGAKNAPHAVAIAFRSGLLNLDEEEQVAA